MELDKIQTVNNLKKVLKEFGYHGSEVNDMIEDLIGDTHISLCSDESLDEVIKSLQTQIDFAEECLSPRIKR